MRPIVRFGTLAVAFLLLVLMARPVSAQGTNGMVADPMGLREARAAFERYTDLRKEQWPLIELAHDEYLIEFTALRDGPVQEYLDEVTSKSAGAAGQIPEYETIKKLFDDGVRINRRIAAVDDAFFRKAAILMDESQGQGIARARTSRARHRNSVSQLSMGQGSSIRPVDEAYWSLELTPEEHMLVDPHLRSYETGMASLTADRLEAANRSMLDLVEVLIEGGFGNLDNEDLQDPEKAQAFMEALQGAMAESTKPLIEAQQEINERELSMARRLQSALSLEKSHQLMKRWVTFSGASSIGLPNTNLRNIELLYSKAIASGELSATEVESLDAIMAQWRSREVTLLTDLAEQIQEIGLMQYSGGMINPEQMGLAYEGIGEINSERGTLASTTEDRINALLGPERIESLHQKIVEQAQRNNVANAGLENLVEPAVVLGGTDGGNIQYQFSSVSDGIVPQPISQMDLLLLVDLLALSDAEKDILKVIHSGYAEDWKAQVKESIDRAEDIQVWVMDNPDERNLKFDMEAHRRKWDAFAEVHATSLVLDDRLFADLEATLVGTNREQRLAAARQFRQFDRIEQLLKHGERQWPVGAEVYLPNPYRIPDLISLDRSLETELYGELALLHGGFAPAVDGFERTLFELAQEAADLDTTRQTVQDIEMESDGEAMSRIQQEFAENMARLEDFNREQARRTKVVSSVVLTEVVPELQDLQQLQIRVVLYDQITGTENQVNMVMQRVLQMGDLSDSQRIAIEEVFQDHLESDAKLAEQLVGALSEIPEKANTMQEQFAQKMQLQRTVERVEFRRNELEERVIDRIKAILTAEQGARISQALPRTGS